MRVIICDICGEKFLESDADISTLSVAWDITSIELDVCRGCYYRLGEFLKPSSNTKPQKPEHPTDTPSHTVEHNTHTVRPKRGEREPINCEHCGNPFVPKTALAKTCSKFCSNHNWLKKQKIKKNPELIIKKQQDELLKKLKEENPINEVPRPDTYRELT